MSGASCWKFSKPVGELTDVISFQMPTGADVLSTDNQNETLCIWAKVDVSRKSEKREFYVVGTGNPLPPVSRGDFIGTVQFMDGKFVVHVFEKRAK